MNGWTNTSSKASSLTAIAANRLPANGMLKHHATQWLWTYNKDRPNIPFMVCGQTIAGQRGIGGITPAMKLKMAA